LAGIIYQTKHHKGDKYDEHFKKVKKSKHHDEEHGKKKH
jgi:hypothetical protein